MQKKIHENVQFVVFLKTGAVVMVTLVWRHSNDVIMWRHRHYWDSTMMLLGRVRSYQADLFTTIAKRDWQIPFAVSLQGLKEY